MINHFKGRMALAHNGNLTNSMELRRMLEEQGSVMKAKPLSMIFRLI